MSNEEKLRATLLSIRDRALHTDPEGCIAAFVDIAEDAQDTLDATAGPTDMERLVEWLENWSEALLLDHQISVGELAAYTKILDTILGYIRTEFLGGDNV